MGSAYRSVHSLKAGVVGASKNNYVTGEEDIEGICDLSGKFIIYFLTFNMLVRQK